MYRVCYEKATKRIIEMQSGGDTPAHLQTLIDNAVNAGHNPADIACEFMDDSQYEAAQLADPILQAEKASSKAKEMKIEAAKEGTKTLILAENWDPTKWKIEEVVVRIKNIETVLGLR